MSLQVDTIAARITGVGPAAVSVVRISGPEAFAILDRLTGTHRPPDRTASLRRLVDASSGEVIDEGIVTCFVGPNSYTGEDVVEFSGHGGALAPALVLDAFLAAGCRRAEPGEFTRRAWLNGRLDLLQAEAVADLIEGRSPVAHRTALDQLDRGLSRRVSELREGLIGLEALLVQHLDFPEEDEAPVGAPAIAVRARHLADDLDELAGTAAEGELLREGALTVLAGPPNAGKSSLLNALAGSDRAIVTEIPGTTRDAIEVDVSLDGFPFRLVDTAGLREDAEAIERMGIEVAGRYLDRADLVLACVPTRGRVGDAHGADGAGDCRDDGSDVRGARADDRGGEAALREAARVVGEVRRRTSAPIVLVWTKADLGAAAAPDEDASATGKAGEVAEPTGPDAVARIELSAETGEGLAELRSLLPRLVFRGLVEGEGEAPVLTRRRHREGVRTAADEVRSFAGAVEGGVPAEFASAHLKSAATALEGLLGVVTSEEVLDALFRTFCIGK